MPLPRRFLESSHRKDTFPELYAQAARPVSARYRVRIAQKESTAQIIVSSNNPMKGDQLCTSHCRSSGRLVRVEVAVESADTLTVVVPANGL
jgi:hypothetical protein